MITLNLNKSILDLEGKHLDLMGKTLAGHLMASFKGDAIKLYDWSKALYKGDPIEVDKADLKTIRAFIEESQSLTNLSKAQLLCELDESEKNSK